MKLDKNFEKTLFWGVKTIYEYRHCDHADMMFAFDENLRLMHGDIHVSSGNYTRFFDDSHGIFTLTIDDVKDMKYCGGVRKFAKRMREAIEGGDVEIVDGKIVESVNYLIYCILSDMNSEING